MLGIRCCVLGVGLGFNWLSRVCLSWIRILACCGLGIGMLLGWVGFDWFVVSILV